MDFDFSEDQLALREGARELLDGLASPTHVRAHAGSDAAIDGRLWQAMVEQGWLGIEVDEASGGIGLGTVEAALLVEELGRHAAPAPFVSTLLALDALPAAHPLRNRVLAGDAIACVAWDVNAPVPYAPSAELAIVLGSDGVYAAELKTSPPREPAMDLTRELGWLDVDLATATKIG